MKHLLINLSNHPSDTWSEAQLTASRDLGEIIEMPFPAVPPTASEEEVDVLAESFKAKILQLRGDSNLIAVHLMGEMNFTYSLVGKLSAEGIHCYASTSQRMVTTNEQGDKVVHFEFVRFRQYK